jgi:hypothetical protein
MKKLIITLALGFAALMPINSYAQVSVNFNIGAQPLWGPVGYDRVDYYYLPAIETYYSVPQHQFVYLNNNNQWVFTNSLPAQYVGYDLYHGYKVVLVGPKPYLNFKNDKVKYAKYKTVKSQPVIRYSTDPKYKTIHANKNGIPPGQAKKIAGGTNQQVKVGGGHEQKGEKGHGKGKK